MEPTRKAPYSVYNDGTGPYAMFTCESCGRDYRAQPVLVEEVKETITKSAFGGIATAFGIPDAMKAAAAQQATAGAAPGAAPGPATPGSGGAPGAACASCGTALAAGAKFCANCGTPVPVKAFCTGCGKELAPGAKFCANCGQAVGA